MSVVAVGLVFSATSLVVRWSRGHAEKESTVSPEFVQFQRVYCAAFLLCLACEYVLASMTFALMRHEHGWSFRRIAEVYALGFSATWVTTAVAERRSSKKWCASCLIAYAVAAGLAAYGGLRCMAASRVLAGIGQPLLQSNFDAWMRAAHADGGYPGVWRRSTYEVVGRGTTFVSVAAGACAEAVRQLTKSDRRPVEAALGLAVLGFLVVFFGWPSLDSTALTSSRQWCESSSLPSTMCTGKAATALAASFAACVFEIANYVTNATWATALAQVDTTGRSPYGLVFSLLMASAVSGTHLFTVFAGTSPDRVACLLALGAAGAFCLLGFLDTTVSAVLLPLFAFQLTAGWSVPAFATLRGKHVPSELRTPLGRFTTALYGCLVLILILWIPADTHLTFACCAGLMVAAFLSCLFVLLKKN